MPLTVKRKKKESVVSLVNRFEMAVKRAGILLRVKERMYKLPHKSRSKKREEALYKLRKTQEIQKLKRWGRI